MSPSDGTQDSPRKEATPKSADAAKRERPLPPDAKEALDRLHKYLSRGPGDPTYIVLKAHLLAEEMLRTFLQKQASHPDTLREAELEFYQLLVLCQAFHRHIGPDWWGWRALRKLNSIRNSLAHNLEPKDVKDRILDFSQFMADSIGATTESEIGIEYLRLCREEGAHPFQLGITSLHMALFSLLSLEPKQLRAALYEDDTPIEPK